MMLTRAIIVFSLFVSSTLAENWPSWRGPHRNGHSTENDRPPLSWSTTKNVLWKIPLPEAGNSTPIIWKDRLFLTQATERGKHRWVMCFSTKDGKLIWKKDTPFNEKESIHRTNTYCAASPVTDGERVIASHGSAGMVCYDMDGKKLWHVELGQLEHIWGNATSPIIYKDLVILWCGPGERQFLLAVNKKTGKKVWQHDEPGGASGKSRPWVGTWSTPIVVKVDDHDELILPVPKKVKGFDPNTGKELWVCEGLTELVYTSPVCSKDGIAVVFSGYHGSALAVRVGGKGDVTNTHRLWVQPRRTPQRIGSPVIIGDHVYLRSERGEMHRFDIKTGKDTWNGRAGRNRGWSSLVVSGDRMYVNTEAGDTLVISTDPELNILATNRVGELMRASPAISEGRIYLHTYEHLWCIGESTEGQEK